jgi:hypothetical protein
MKTSSTVVSQFDHRIGKPVCGKDATKASKGAK